MRQGVCGLHSSLALKYVYQMNDWIINRIVARPNHGIEPDDVAVLRKMGTYWDRASLKIVWDNGATGRDLVMHISDDAVRYEVTLAEMIAGYERMRGGVALDWATLRRVPRPSDAEFS